MPLEDFIIYVYCCVADIYPQVLDGRLRHRGFKPKLTDSEVIAMEIVGEFLGQDKDQGIRAYFRDHWHRWFPHLGSRSNFAKHCANLWATKQCLLDGLTIKLNGYSD
ncbi:MAG: IS982 family transposase, partial [Methylobacter sp.]|nr:IS982 family transposase [Methylobacter sp.]